MKKPKKVAAGDVKRLAGALGRQVAWGAAVHFAAGELARYGQEIMARPCVCGHALRDHHMHYEPAPLPSYPGAKKAVGKACKKSGCVCIEFERVSEAAR